MYTSNPERNRVIYELWEKNLTVDQISSRTGVPRSTVGYYVRKFNKLAVEEKPIVFPRERKIVSARRDSPFSNFIQPVMEMAVKKARANILLMLSDGKYQQLYYLLMDLKLIKELDSIVTSETFKKAIKSIESQ